MKKQSGFQLRSGNNPSPNKFFKGLVSNISKKIGGVIKPPQKAIMKGFGNLLGLEPMARRTPRSERNFGQKFNELLKIYGPKT